MGRELQGEYYTSPNGSCPVAKWLDKQSNEVQAKMHGYMELLETSPDLGRFPFVRKLDSGLYEIKTKVAGTWPRIIYFYFDKDKVVYLHAFMKKSNKTPPNEIKIAKERKKDIENRREK